MTTGLQLFMLLCLSGVLLALMGTLLYLYQLRQSVTTAPRLPQMKAIAAIEEAESTGKVSVIIPAYNEIANIEACVTAVLQSSVWGSDRLEVWVVDDQSTDDTLQRVQTLQTTLADPRLKVLVGQARPTDQSWVGKNWACHQAAQQATGDYLLFIDADVRLQPGAIATAIAYVQHHQIDLMTCVLAIVCGCWAEWLAQPIIAGFVIALLPFFAVNDPNSDAVFAAGPWMLFRRTAYAQVGGHAAVADQVVEDVELARRIKQKGLNLQYVAAPHLGTLRMYLTNAALWEGWTKNWHASSQRNIKTTLAGAMLVFWVCALPLLELMGWGSKGAIASFTGWDAVGMAIALGCLLLQYPARRQIQSVAAIPPRYWWLSGLGGLYVTALILTSIIKTETGWGWTWRGRSLHPARLQQNNPQL